jgi:hypothetical protein
MRCFDERHAKLRTQPTVSMAGAASDRPGRCDLDVPPKGNALPRSCLPRVHCSMVADGLHCITTSACGCGSASAGCLGTTSDVACMVRALTRSCMLAVLYHAGNTTEAPPDIVPGTCPAGRKLTLPGSADTKGTCVPCEPGYYSPPGYVLRQASLHSLYGCETHPSSDNMRDSTRRCRVIECAAASKTYTIRRSATHVLLGCTKARMGRFSAKSALRDTSRSTGRHVHR